MDGGRSDEALGVADEAMALAVEHDLTVDRTDLTSILARLSESAGDPGESIRRLEMAVAAWTSAPDLALLRAMHILASVHYRQGDHVAALAAFERTLAEARRAGLEWSVFGVDTRAMAVTTAYEMGDWDLALRLADHTTDAAMPSSAAASIDAAALGVLAGRGGVTADELLVGARPWWPEEGRIAVQSGATAIDVLGRDGDVDGMLALHAEVVGFLRDLWGHGRVAAEVRLAALAVGHLGTTLRGQPPARRAVLLDHVDRLSAEAAAVWGGGPGGALLLPPTVEGQAWEARATAEQQRAHWAAGEDVPLRGLVDASRRVVDLFVQHGEIYEVARARTRLAEVLLAAGDPGADEVLAAARETAERLGAAPLLAVLDDLAPRQAPRSAPLGVDRPRGRGARAARRGSLQRRDRPGPVHQHQDGERARLEHPRQARRGIPRRGRGAGPRLGPARRLSALRGGRRLGVVAAAQGEDAVGQRDDEQARPEHVRDDERLGQVREVLHVADQPLREGDAQHHQPGPRRAPLVVDRGQPGREPGGDHQPDEDHDEVGVQPGDGPRVEAEPVGLVGVPRVGAGAGDDGTECQHGRTGGHGDPAQTGDQRWDERPRRTGTVVPGEPEVGRRRDQGHREQEVRGDRRGVQPEHAR